MRRILFFLFLFSFQITLAQKKDSLLQVLERAAPAERANVLMKIGDAEMPKDPAKAVERFQEALLFFRQEQDTLRQIDAMQRIATGYLRQNKNELAHQLDSTSLRLAEIKKYPQGIAAALFNIGRYQAAKGKFRESIQSYLKYIDIQKSLGKEPPANAYNQIGVGYRNLSEYDNARKYYETGLTLAQKTKDERVQAVLYMNLGNVYSITGDYDEALTQQLQSIRIKEKLDDKNGLVQSYINTANIYTNMKQLDKTLEYYYKSLALKSSIQNPRSLALIYNNLGTAHARMFHFDSALHYVEQSLQIRKEQNDRVGIAQSYVNLGSIYRDKKDYAKALEYYQQSLMLRESLQSKDDQADIYSNIGTLYAKLGQKKKGEEFFVKSLNLYQQTGSASIKETLVNLTSYYESTGDLEKASRYRTELVQLNDSLINDEVRNRLVKLEAEMEIERKQNQLLLAQQRSELKTSQITGLLLALGLVIVILVVVIKFYYDKKKIATELQKKNDRIHLLIRELHHRVKNNLLTISSLLSLQSFRVADDNAREALREGQTRVDAMALIHQKLYLDDNLRGVDMNEYVEALLGTLTQSFGYNRSIVESRVEIRDAKLDVDIAIPLGLIINELVINAFKHAFHSVAHPELQVLLQAKGANNVELMIRDNGSGILEENLKEQNPSFGLKLVRTLAKQLNASLSIRNERGAVFQLVLSEK